MITLANISAASFMPGLQNSGNISGTALISGTLNASPSYPHNTSNMTNAVTGMTTVPIVIQLPDPSVISLLRVNLPDANGDLSSKWFPLIGTVVLYDFTQQIKLIIYETSHPDGRALYYNFVNLVNAGTTFTNYRINIYGHLFTFPWAQ